MRSYGVDPQGSNLWGSASTTTSFTTTSPPNAPTFSAPASGATNVSATPAITFATTDNESNKIKYKVQIAKDSGFTVSLQTFDQTVSQTGFSGQNATIATTNDSYTSGTTATYTIQTPLSGGTVYYMRAYGIDPEGTNTWGSVATTRSFRTAFAPGTGGVFFETQTAFSGATYNRMKDEGTSDLLPHLTTPYHELAADINTVGLYHFNNNGNDSSGNSYTLTANGTPAFSKIGRAHV